MTKMAAMLIHVYGKTLQKSSSLELVYRFKRNLGLKYYNVYINHDCVMTLTYFKARSTWVPMHLNGGKLLTCHLRGNGQMDRILIILKTNGPRASSAPALGLNTIIMSPKPKVGDILFLVRIASASA